MKSRKPVKVKPYGSTYLATLTASLDFIDTKSGDREKTSPTGLLKNGSQDTGQSESVKNSNPLKPSRSHYYAPSSGENSGVSMKALSIELAKCLYECFVTDQASFALQQSDGSYRRRSGIVTPQLLAGNLADAGSIAVYQKNNDQTVKWICFDFDILKRHLETKHKAKAEEELYRAVSAFCVKLYGYRIPYLLEFSGNRGFHVWITFEEDTDYGVAYSILETILTKTELSFDSELIAIDKFPSTRRPSGGFGKAVKLPVSMHRKSNVYSLLLQDIPTKPCPKVIELDNEVLKQQTNILSSHRGTTKSELERLLGEFFLVSSVDSKDRHRIKTIDVLTTTLSIDMLAEHWQAHPPLAELAKAIVGEIDLGHQKRKLLVGILGNVRCKNKNKVGHQLIHNIAKKHHNYNHEITEKAISALASYNFPSQEQIEGETLQKFGEDLTLGSLIAACIPSIDNYEEAIFEIGLADIEVAKISELNYLYLNDEVHIHTVIDELASRSTSEMHILVKQIIEQEVPSISYSHIRAERHKNRRLVTLDAATRVATSCILKQLLYFLDFKLSPNSYGYRANRGFQGGHIFKPWLYLWIKFVSNISSAIQADSNKNYFIVKTDILSFYDDVPHDNMKRLLLGGVNPKIDEKVESLDTASHNTYKDYIDVLFRITESIVGDKKGLPQGPAYARYLAELYLVNIDEQFDNKLKGGTLYLYQRYVDDIFFISPTEEAARNTLEDLKRSLELLGLSINLDKTAVSEICNFSDDFNSYRAQSKYAVDRASRDFPNATDTQKNLAINEFIALVQSDNCEDDLAFVFSHLDGVEAVDSIKRELVLPTITSGIGRGSLYKHLFSFILNDHDNWETLEQVDSFTKLQSEVLTAVFITQIEENKQATADLLKLFKRIGSRLCFSQVVEEHIALLNLKYGFHFSISLVSPEAFISCLKVQDKGEALTIQSSLVNYINTALNNIKRLDEFSRVMYSLCSSTSLSSEDLNHLARTFYAKISSDHHNRLLDDPASSVIRDAKTAWRFYYLLCVFSLSEVNPSIELLQSMWKFCAELFNRYRLPQMTGGIPNWFAKIGGINLHPLKTQFMIATIVDGNVFRGLLDECKVFEMFHNNLLIYWAFQDSDNNTGNIQEALKTLESCGTFYQWLANRDEVTLFPNPSNRKWFERNVMENGTIILRKGSQVLFRKPTEDFHPESTPINPHNGYSEVIETYCPNNLRSFGEAVESVDLKDLLDRILEAATFSQDIDRFPNVFVNEKMLEENSWHPFSRELLASRSLIFEDAQGDTQVFPCTARHFIGCCLLAARSGPTSALLRGVNEKYLENLPKQTDIIEFLTNIVGQLVNYPSELFYFDLAAASSFNLMLQSLDPLKRLDKFVDTYHKFNPETKDRHVYGVVLNKIPNDSNPMVLVHTIVDSLSAIRMNTMRSLAFFLDKDVDDFKDCLQKVAKKIPGGKNGHNIEHFKQANVKLYHTSSKMDINGKYWEYGDVRLLNYDTEELVEFEQRFSPLVNSSEHVYLLEINGLLHLLAIPHALSKIYHSIEQRYNSLKEVGAPKQSFPCLPVKIESISELPNFQTAVQVVAIHRNMKCSESETLVINWLQCLPENFHAPLVNLIAGHVVMTSQELESFTKAVWDARNGKRNPILLKRPGDHGGTHRVLQRDSELGRILEKLAPTTLPQDTKIITLVIDSLLSGSQTKKALEYYCGISNGKNSRNDEGYYNITPEESQCFLIKLQEAEEINICSVSYTEKAIEKITRFLREQAESNAIVDVTNGNNISENAFFGSSQRIGEVDKESIKRLLCDTKSAAHLGNLLSPPKLGRPTIFVKSREINDYNLVARFGSMPKKGFLFLARGLRHAPDCHPFDRVRETYEM